MLWAWCSEPAGPPCAPPGAHTTESPSRGETRATERHLSSLPTGSRVSPTRIALNALPPRTRVQHYYPLSNLVRFYRKTFQILNSVGWIIIYTKCSMFIYISLWLSRIKHALQEYAVISASKEKSLTGNISCCVHVHSPTLNIMLRNTLSDKIPEKQNKINRPDFICSPVICFLPAWYRITTNVL